jgi:hypothetical protein
LSHVFGHPCRPAKKSARWWCVVVNLKCGELSANILGSSPLRVYLVLSTLLNSVSSQSGQRASVRKDGDVFFVKGVSFYGLLWSVGCVTAVVELNLFRRGLNRGICIEE